jgi:transcriptional regulator with XRE-family HTH domain
MKSVTKIAPEFAKKFSGILQDYGKTQRQIASECKISSSVINRLCKDGTGSENHICIVLRKFDFKRRRIIEFLADRRAELSDEVAKEIWKDFKYAFLDEDEYLNEICPFPFERAFACTHLGIPVKEVVKLAKAYGISNIQDLRDISTWKLYDFVKASEEKFGSDATKIIFSKTCPKFPPVLLFEFEQQKNAKDYIKLVGCEGQLFFGLPHIVLADYVFSENGKICAHPNTGGVEMIYSLEGVFELTCAGKICQTKLRSRNSILIYDAREKHSIKLVEGTKGRLLIARFDPKRRYLAPGRPRRVRKNAQA